MTTLSAQPQMQNLLPSAAEFHSLTEEEKYAQLVSIFNGTSTMFQNFKASFEPEYDKENEIKYWLNTELPQYKIGKTGKLLKYLAEYYYRHDKPKNNNKEHIITIMATSNSLLESKQWKSRSKKYWYEKSGIIIQQLSSANDSEYNKMNALMGDLMSRASNKRGTLPHIIIMCSNSARIDRDCINLLQMLSEWQNPSIKFKFNFMFDEVDKTISHICTLIREIKKRKVNYLVKDIILITATPQSIYPKLKKEGVRELLNLDKALDLQDRTIANEQYRSIKNHDCIKIEGPEDPLNYAKHIMQKRPDLFDEISGKTIFAPSKYYTRCHEECGKFWREKGWHVFLANGKFKGFIDTVGNRTRLQEYLKKDEETRDGLRRWREKHPNEGLVITGWTCIERGITFNTDGFNFDLMILSAYHGRYHNCLQQVVGRGAGDEDYCDKMKVILPQALYDTCVAYIDNMIKLKKENFTVYDEKCINRLTGEKIDPFRNIGEHAENTFDELVKWIGKEERDSSGNLISKPMKKDGTSYRPNGAHWKKKEKNSDGFILHNFGDGEGKVQKIWSIDDARKSGRAGLKMYSARIYPCYEDINNPNTLKWVILWRIKEDE